MKTTRKNLDVVIVGADASGIGCGMVLRDRRFLCGYVNTTPQVQIIRVANIPNWYEEARDFSQTTPLI